MPESLDKKRERERVKRLDPAYREKKNNEEKARYHASTEYRARCAVRGKKWRLANPTNYKDPVIRARYKQYRWRANGIKPTYPAPDVCENCGRRPKGALNADHCHETGVFRGWLCPACNRGLGLIGDSKYAVRRLLAYVERTR